MHIYYAKYTSLPFWTKSQSLIQCYMKWQRLRLSPPLQRQAKQKHHVCVCVLCKTPMWICSSEDQ